MTDNTVSYNTAIGSPENMVMIVSTDSVDASDVLIVHSDAKSAFVELVPTGGLSVKLGRNPSSPYVSRSTGRLLAVEWIASNGTLSISAKNQFATEIVVQASGRGRPAAVYGANLTAFNETTGNILLSTAAGSSMIDISWGPQENTWTSTTTSIVAGGSTQWGWENIALILLGVAWFSLMVILGFRKSRRARLLSIVL
jgi:hypothetical protein